VALRPLLSEGLPFSGCSNEIVLNLILINRQTNERLILIETNSKINAVHLLQLKFPFKSNSVNWKKIV